MQAIITLHSGEREEDCAWTLDLFLVTLILQIVLHLPVLPDLGFDLGWIWSTVKEVSTWPSTASLASNL